MKIIDVLTSPWAIIPEKLNEIKEIYSTHLRGEKIDFKSAKQLKAEEPEEPYQIIDDVAIIPVHGVIAKRMNMFLNFSGGTSSELIGRDINKALTDDSIKGIILDVDSPGGTVDGTAELAELVYQGRSQKPIIAYSDGLMASAAYWIGSAAHQIYISSGTVQVGSIGVVASHVDYSEYEKKQGIKTTEIYAGKYKRISSQYEPLSKDGKRSIQDEVDYLYSIFVDGVARNRDKKSEEIAKTEAKIFIGKQAKKVGLVDGVDTMLNIIGRVADGVSVETTTNNANITYYDGISWKSEGIMTKEELKEKYPDLFASIKSGGEKIGYENGLTEGETKGIETGKIMERKRIQAVADVSLPGHEKLVETMMFDGTEASDAATKVLAAEKEQRKIASDVYKDSSIDPVDYVETGDNDTQEKPFERLVDEKMKSSNCSRGQAIRFVIENNPDAHEEYLQRINKGVK